MGNSWNRAGRLTANAIVSLNNGDLDLKPVLQVLDIQQIGDPRTPHERYSMLLSDGAYIQQASLAAQLNDYVNTGKLQKGSVIRLIEHGSDSVQNRRAEQEGIKLRPMDVRPLIESVKRNNLQSDYFFIGTSKSMKASLVHHLRQWQQLIILWSN